MDIYTQTHEYLVVSIRIFVSLPSGLDLFANFSLIQSSIKLLKFSDKYMYWNKKSTVINIVKWLNKEIPFHIKKRILLNLLKDSSGY